MKHEEGVNRNSSCFMFSCFTHRRSSRLFRSRQPAHAGQQRIVLMTLPDRDAELVSQAGAIEESDEDSLRLESQVGVAAAAVGDAGEDEIRAAGQHGPTELR